MSKKNGNNVPYTLACPDSFLACTELIALFMGHSVLKKADKQASSLL